MYGNRVYQDLTGQSVNFQYCFRVADGPGLSKMTLRFTQSPINPHHRHLRAYAKSLSTPVDSHGCDQGQ